MASFAWLSYNLDRNTLINQPRLSSFLLLLVSGSAAFAASLFTGADGRFDSDAALKLSSSTLPPRPRRYYVPCIIILVLVRLELSYRALHDFQCAAAGIEAFLPSLFAAYKFFSHRVPPTVSDEPEDMWGSWQEDLKAWLAGSPIMLLVATVLVSYGTFAASNLTLRSTYFCSPLLDSGSLVVFIQWINLFVDALILILLWRVLSWARTTRSRLRTLGGILLVASFATCVPLIGTQLSLRGQIIGHQSLIGVYPFHIADTLSTSMFVAPLVISGSLMLCDASPLEPTTIATFIYGLITSISSTVLIGTYRQTSSMQPLLGFGSISFGFVIFTYTNSMRSIVLFKRVYLIILLLFVSANLVLYATLIPTLFKHHPVDDLVYRSRIEADRWLRHATVSTTLKLAVQEYGERHSGRKPPQNFDKWFEFAKLKKSVVIDKFDQMETDVLPFWGLKPQEIRDGLQFLKTQPNIGIVVIDQGKATHAGATDSSQQEIMDEIVTIISAFAEHLPAMELAINLQERPRVLVPSMDMRTIQLRATAQRAFKRDSNRLGIRDTPDTSAPEDNESNKRTAPATGAADTGPMFVPTEQFRNLEARACPFGSPVRDGYDWNMRDFCASCAAPQSKHQFLANWQKALDPCYQPDIFHLHDFHTTPHRFEVYQKLLPLFSGSKTTTFSDLLIPFTRGGFKKEFETTAFNQKQDIVLWQGNVEDMPTPTHESLHGSHRLRLVHMLQNATSADSVPMLLGIGAGKDSRFRYEDVPTTEANSILPLQFSLTGPPEGCKDAHCELLRDEFGLQEPATEVDSRYVMLLDSSDGPPRELQKVLHSNSVPVLSSIFQQWFTERLMPWVHFVPIDLRYHALHSTLSYFIGLDGRGTLNGRKQVTPERAEDAKWIAHQGRKWAETAMRKEDMEVYLFRLLLEWGRVIDEKRDEMGFVLKEA
ncbi:hypothetical protein F4808DRAFT_263959 [Astrocystis sublimbata]|nr:hypothetical protein F4808DRAFT_263959 [Astrocystis sublimbata]